MSWVVAPLLFMKARTITIGDKELKSGDKITIEGSSGKVFLGEVPTKEADLNEDFNTLMEWSNKYKKMHVRTNADTPKDVQKALKFGAEELGYVEPSICFLMQKEFLLLER